MSWSESRDTLEEFKVQLMGLSAAVLYGLMATILPAVERRPRRRGAGIQGDPSDSDVKVYG